MYICQSQSPILSNSPYPLGVHTLFLCICVSICFITRSSYYISKFHICINIQYLFLSLFIYLGLCWVVIAVHRLSLVAMSRGYSLLGHAGFSLWWLLLLQSTVSRVLGLRSCGFWALEHRLSSCAAPA